jgi:hypothetical protein
MLNRMTPARRERDAVFSDFLEGLDLLWANLVAS